jgi:hypothetical protein
LAAVFVTFAVVAIVITEMFGFFAAMHTQLNALTLSNGLTAFGVRLFFLHHITSNQITLNCSQFLVMNAFFCSSHLIVEIAVLDS